MLVVSKQVYLTPFVTLSYKMKLELFPSMYIAIINKTIKILYGCRHRNLVDLMGFCTDPPALIYEYMEQGNLFDRLFNKVFTRFQVML